LDNCGLDRRESTLPFEPSWPVGTLTQTFFSQRRRIPQRATVGGTACCDEARLESSLQPHAVPGRPRFRRFCRAPRNAPRAGAGRGGRAYRTTTTRPADALLRQAIPFHTSLGGRNPLVPFVPRLWEEPSRQAVRAGYRDSPLVRECGYIGPVGDSQRRSISRFAASRSRFSCTRITAHHKGPVPAPGSDISASFGPSSSSPGSPPAVGGRAPGMVSRTWRFLISMRRAIFLLLELPSCTSARESTCVPAPADAARLANRLGRPFQSCDDLTFFKLKVLQSLAGLPYYVAPLRGKLSTWPSSRCLRRNWLIHRRCSASSWATRPNRRKTSPISSRYIGSGAGRAPTEDQRIPAALAASMDDSGDVNWRPCVVIRIGVFDGTHARDRGDTRGIAYHDAYTRG